MTHQNQAILFSGDEDMDLRAQQHMHRHLVESANYNPNNITLISGNEVFSLGQALSKTTKNPLTLIYTGHGSRTGLHPIAKKPNLRVNYTKLAKAIEKYHAQDTLIILSSCHAGAAIPVFEQKGLLHENMVLSASSAKDLAYGHNLIYNTVIFAQRQLPLPKNPTTHYLTGAVRLSLTTIDDIEYFQPKEFGKKETVPRQGKDLTYLLYATTAIQENINSTPIPQIEVEVMQD